MNRRFVSASSRGLLVLTAFAVAAFVACGEEKNGPKTGSNSNWLIACVDENECAVSGSCLCGACSRECSDDSDCADLAGARCGVSDQTAASTQCGSAPLGPGLCLPRCTLGSCPSGQSCVDGACVLAKIPISDFCDPAQSPSADQRALEDELTTLIQQNRVDGTIACAGGVNSEPAPALRLDGRLRCVARVKALDQAETGVSGPLDSLGRDGSERLSLAGYDASSWWETYAFDATTVSEAYQLFLTDTNSCPELGSPAYLAVGIGNADDVFVVVLASD